MPSPSMRSTFLIASLLTAIVSVNAHFQLQFPPPRGEFDEDKEPTFCDGYLEPADNRTEFPLNGGFVTLKSEHAKWTAGVLISTEQKVSSFNQFSQVNGFFQLTGEGDFCIPLNFSTSNVTTLQDRQNATIQIVFDGGDGALYQCADVTLSSTATIASSVQCTNGTSSDTGNSTGSNSTSGGSSNSGAVALPAELKMVVLAASAALVGVLFI